MVRKANNATAINNVCRRELCINDICQLIEGIGRNWKEVEFACTKWKWRLHQASHPGPCPRQSADFLLTTLPHWALNWPHSLPSFSTFSSNFPVWFMMSRGRDFFQVSSVRAANQPRSLSPPLYPINAYFCFVPEFSPIHSHDPLNNCYFAFSRWNKVQRKVFE